MVRFDEIADKLRKTGKKRKRNTDGEHRLQAECVRTFSMRYPRLRGLLFAVPNGGKRDEVTAAKLNAEGVVSGVSDLILLCKRGRYGALLIEMKTPKGVLSPSQKRWRALVEGFGEYRYVVCRSTSQFFDEVDAYLSLDDRQTETTTRTTTT